MLSDNNLVIAIQMVALHRLFKMRDEVEAMEQEAAQEAAGALRPFVRQTEHGFEMVARLGM